MQRGNRIRELRQASGIKLEDLADEVGIHFTTLARWETGDTKRLPRDEKLDLLAKRLGVTVPFLMGWSNGDVPDEAAA